MTTERALILAGIALLVGMIFSKIPPRL